MVLAAWTAHPAKRRPRDVALVAAVLLLTCGAVLSSLESLWLSVLAAVLIVGSVAAFLFPTGTFGTFEQIGPVPPAPARLPLGRDPAFLVFGSLLVIGGRTNCLLEVEGDGACYLVHAGHGLHIQVNGRRISQECELRDGDVIQPESVTRAPLRFRFQRAPEFAHLG